MNNDIIFSSHICSLIDDVMKKFTTEHNKSAII